MLILRVHAGLPTMYQFDLDHVYLFNDKGVFEFNCRSNGQPPDMFEIRRRTTLPTETWALIDSNQSLVGVPPAYQTNYIVVQAALPRSERIAWKDKVNRSVGLYIMQPWTITELLHGYAV